MDHPIAEEGLIPEYILLLLLELLLGLGPVRLSVLLEQTLRLGDLCGLTITTELVFPLGKGNGKVIWESIQVL